MCLTDSKSVSGAVRLAIRAGPVVAMLFGFAAPALAQQTSELDCQGQIYGYQATLQGVRAYQPYNAAGDGEVRFSGTISAANITGSIQYGGYTQVGAFEGYIQSPAGTVAIGVLDNTGGRMIIYDGAPSLGPPPEIGTFVCQWR